MSSRLGSGFPIRLGGGLGDDGIPSAAVTMSIGTAIAATGSVPLPPARLTAYGLEMFLQNVPSAARLTQYARVTLVQSVSEGRATQLAREVLAVADPMIRVSQFATETLLVLVPSPADARLSQFAWEALAVTTSNARISQLALEVLVAA
jgi:hypothetical protein